MHKLKIIELGDELAVILPDEMPRAMRLEEGSSIAAIPEAGGILLKTERADPALSE